MASRETATVGRHDERSRLQALLDDTSSTARVALIEGPAGIGKTTLWDEARSTAARAGRLVVTTRCVESETSLAFAGLGDLLAPLAAHIDELPSRQSSTLRAVLQHDDPIDAAADELTVGRATTGVLAAAAGAGTGLVIAVDDVQWLDQPSARALSFALRRLAGSGVRALITRRTSGTPGASDMPPLEADRWWQEPTLERVQLGPLDVGEIDLLLRATFDVRLRRPQLLDLHRRTEGNPLYALEIVRAAVQNGTTDAPLQIPPDLHAVLRQRIAALPAATRDALLVVAAAGRPSSSLVERVLGDAGVDALNDADDVLVIDGDELRFSHPLLAEAVLGAATPWERRRAHRAVAEATTDREARARHLAIATVEPDADVAVELERAAGAAAARGATEIAAALSVDAYRLTPPDDERRVERTLLAAERLSTAGDPDRAASLLRELCEQLPPGRQRADVLRRLSTVDEVDLATSVALCEQALEECEGDATIAANIHLHLATYTWLQGDLPASNEHGRRAAEFAEASGDVALASAALADLGHGMAVQGIAGWEDVLAHAVEIAPHDADDPDAPIVNSAAVQQAITFVYTDRTDEARPVMHDAVQRARRRGDESQLVEALFRLFELELRAGDWSAAAAAAHECAALARQAGVGQEQAVAGSALVILDAHLGRAEQARSRSDDVRRLLDTIGDTLVDTRLRGGLGLLALSSRDARGALDVLEPALAHLRRSGVRELSIHLVAHNALEAHVAVGELDEAEELAAWIDECGRPTARPWHRAMAERGRALVASARGDDPGAAMHIAAALDAHAEFRQPFELARTQLADGTIARRARRRAHARTALTEAIDGFDRLGAAMWAEYARGELARVSGRTPAGEQLSTSEQRVVELVADGMTNQEIAATLFVSLRTVEATLTRVYRKLGVRSRTELLSRPR